jgi:hypothetical protein
VNKLLVVLSRPRGTPGWTVQVGDGALELPAVLLPKGVRIVLTRPDTFRLVRPALSRVTCRETDGNDLLSEGEVASLRSPLGVVEVAAFHEAGGRVPKPDALGAITALRREDTPTTRAVLHDVLEESGAFAEAEYVRREEAVFNGTWSSPGYVEELRALRALGAIVGQTFRYLVGRDVKGCAGLRWTLKCAAEWTSLQPTEDDHERLCVTCRQLVVRTDDEEHAADLARSGVCVSYQPSDDPAGHWVGEIAADD